METPLMMFLRYILVQNINLMQSGCTGVVCDVSIMLYLLDFNGGDSSVTCPSPTR